MNTVVITGASSGIGLALGREFEKNKFKVIALDYDPKVKSTWASSYLVDVSQEDKLLEVAKKIKEEHGRISIWINNAGITKLGAFEDVQPIEFNRVIEVNFLGVVYGTRAALSIMCEPRVGTIVNVASMSGLLAAPFMTSYSASKHAVVGFTRALQLEAQQSHSAYQYVLVLPGFVDTPIMADQGKFSFPRSLKFLVDTPEVVAGQIYDGILSGKKEIVPSFNGKLMYAFQRIAPFATMRTSKILTAKNLKQLIGLESIAKKK